MLLPPVQTFLAQRATAYLKTEFNIDANIGRLAIKLPNKVALQDVYIADDQGDTLIFAETLNVTYAGFDGERNQIMSSSIQLDNGRLYMRKYPEDSLFNFALFLKKFDSGKPPTQSEPFRMKVADIDITNFRFTKHRLGCTDSCTNIFLKETQVHVKDFFLDGAYVTGNIMQMRYNDIGRFQLYEFRGKAAYQPTYMALRELYFKTDGSEVDGEAFLYYDSPDELANFLDNVSLRGVFKNSTFNSNEFKAYIPEFPQFDTFTVTGVFNGPINDFTLENAVIKMGNNTRFFGEARLKNPSEAALLQIDAKAGKIQTTPAELRRYVGQFTGEMEWMQLIDEYNTITYSGTYNGTVKDFDINGTLQLDENTLQLAGKMNGFDDIDRATYDGSLTAKPVNLGKLLQSKSLGMAAFTTRVKGQGLTTSSINSVLNAQVQYIDLLDYRYHNLQLQGNVGKQRFDGIASLRDKNLNFDFEGLIDFASDTVDADFCADVIDANLHELKFFEDTISTLNFNADIDFKVASSSWWDGEIQLTDITYEGYNHFYFYDSLSLYSNNVDSIHTDKVKSKIADVELNGKYELPLVYKALVAEYQGFNRLEKEETERPQIDFTYRALIKNAEVVTEVFLPDLSIEPNSLITGLYMGSNNIFELHANSSKTSWKKTGFYELDFDAYHEDSSYTINTEIASISFGRQSIDSVKADANFTVDSAWLATSGIYRDSIDSYFRVSGYAFDSTTAEEERYFMFLDNGRFNIGEQYFSLYPDNKISFENNKVRFERVGFYDKESAIEVNGFVSDESTDILRINAQKIDATLLNYIIRYRPITLEGLVGGELLIGQENEKPKFAGNLQVDSLFVNKDYLGTLKFNSNWDIETGMVSLDADVLRGRKEILNAKGTILPDSAGKLDMAVSFDRFRLMWLDPLVEGIFENVRGTLSGQVALTGNVSAMETNGKVYLTQGALAVPYFNVDYGFPAETEILIRTNKLILPETTVNDTYENTTGIIGGEVSHNNWTDWSFDMKLNSDNLLVLNTKNSAEAYFYGKGYAAGTFGILGPINDLSIDVDIKTKPGTEFKIPFSNPLNVGEQSFITYYGNSKVEYIEINPEAIANQELKTLGGLDISIKAQVTSDALIQLVMDETVGDVISGRGRGDLRIEIPYDGDMEMFGSVEITAGDYLFTMRNLINKKFTIIPGGRITWNGDPYLAVLDMKAKYSTRTTLTGFVTNNYDGQRVQVDLLMGLDGAIVNPNINFEIELPNSNPSYQEELNNRLNDADRLNQQAFSLLVINSFWLGTDGFFNQGLSSNTMQMAATQFSNFLAQGLGDYVDISVGYNSATDNGQDPNNPSSPPNGNQLSDEVEVGISKNFLDDRITVNTTLDVPVEAGSNQSFAGDIEVVYKITRDGRIRAKAFNRNNQDNPALDKLAPYTQGVGIFYQTSFNTWGDFARKLFGIKPKESKEEGNEHKPID